MDHARPADESVGIAALIDHTLLKADATETEIDRLCDEALGHRFAFVCVNPVWVRMAAARLAGSRTGICSVVAFPLGATLTTVKVFEARQAVADGARELDMVLHLGALRAGAIQHVEGDIAAVVRAAREGDATVKVIIEAALLSEEEKVTACRIAQKAGAAFVKTSTGFGAGGATVADVMLMRRTVGDRFGVKAAGGIRDLKTLKAMVAAGANRIGTSAGAAILEEARTVESHRQPLSGGD
jgi:deoxyribose-phosphate aldolase